MSNSADVTDLLAKLDAKDAEIATERELRMAAETSLANLVAYARTPTNSNFKLPMSGHCVEVRDILARLLSKQDRQQKLLIEAAKTLRKTGCICCNYRDRTRAAMTRRTVNRTELRAKLKAILRLAETEEIEVKGGVMLVSITRYEALLKALGSARETLSIVSDQRLYKRLLAIDSVRLEESLRVGELHSMDDVFGERES